MFDVRFIDFVQTIMRFLTLLFCFTLLSTVCAAQTLGLMQRLERTNCTEKIVLVLPTVPRSGNTLFRLLFHYTTGLQTSSVFGEAKTLERLDGVTVQAPQNESHSVDICRLLVKLHWPFLATTQAPHFPFFGQIRAVRDPLTNYGAWLDYCAKHTWCHVRSESNFADFAARWAAHHIFWDSLAIPTVTFRFETLTSAPASVLQSVFEAYKPLSGFLPKLSYVARQLDEQVKHSNRQALHGTCKNGHFAPSSAFNVSVLEYRAAVTKPEVARVMSTYNIAKRC